jgi:nickel/cobalt transporter (NiCoT) family protein
LSERARRQAALVGVAVGGLQFAAWGAALSVSAHQPALLALCGLAYSFGLRHGLDVDHIVAIDNVSRDLLGRGIRPTGLGLFFALGHSSVIALASIAIAGAALRFNHVFGHVGEWVGIYTTLISVSMLLLVAPRNLMAAWHSFRAIRGLTASDPHPPHSGRLVRWAMRRLESLHVKTWHMFFVGALFGLGFETASAMTMLALTGAQATGGAEWSCILVFPLLFTAGMTLVDTTDAVFVEYAYRWALRRPRDHAIYNLVITGFSSAAALFVGILELTSLLAASGPTGGSGSFIARLEEHFDLLGGAVVLIVAGIWFVAVIHQRSTRLSGAGTTAPGIGSLDAAP